MAADALSYIEDQHQRPIVANNVSLIVQGDMRRNIAANIALSIPRFMDRRPQKHHAPIAIVAGGPSLAQTVEQVRKFRYILVCGSPHDYVMAQRIRPNWVVVANADPVMKDNLQHPFPTTSYLLASHCHPSLFARLSKFHVELWHMRGAVMQFPDTDATIFQGEPAIAWGSTVTLMSIEIAARLGFTDLYFFGLDSSYVNYAGSVQTHAYGSADDEVEDKVSVEVGTRKMFSNGAMLLQAEHFFRIIEVANGSFHATIHGDGLIAEMVKQGDPALAQYVSVA